jgi:hypothetical protein
MALTTFLSEIKTRVAATLFTAGYTSYQVKRGEMSNSPDEQVALNMYAGNPPNLGFSIPGLQFENPGLQIAVRGATTDFEGPEAVIDLLYADLVKVQDEYLSGSRYLIIRANQQPFLAERDGNQRCIWKCNFICEKEA